MPKNRLIALKLALTLTTVLLFLTWVIAPEMSDLELDDFNVKGCPFSITDSTLVFRRHQHYPAKSMIAATDIQNGSTRYTRFLSCTPNEVGEYLTKTGMQIHLHSMNSKVILKRSLPSYFEPDELYGHMLVCTSVKGLSFLAASQKAKLDAVAFRFDGFPALTRLSMIKRLELSEKSTKALTKFLDDIRSNTTIPRFRMNFGGSKEADFEIREISFSASMYAYVNMSMVDILSEEECTRLAKFLAEYLNQDAVDLVESIATLPNGLWMPKK